MKLENETGSLVNYIYSNCNQPAPVVGMGATVLWWSDRSPATIIKVEGNMVALREDNARRIDKNGMSDCQDYEYTPNELGREYNFRLNAKKGRWEQVYRNSGSGRWVVSKGCGLIIGRREKYHDFSF